MLRGEGNGILEPKWLRAGYNVCARLRGVNAMVRMRRCECDGANAKA